METLNSATEHSAFDAIVEGLQRARPYPPNLGFASAKEAWEAIDALGTFAFDDDVESSPEP
ncbi:MAG: hypothetical protein QOF76_3351 [Solirubrobacteraceae bacterium]|jgi:hypothetical protein|nr:hypothetical protein [Solirubrobacteraceae bacterium]